MQIRAARPEEIERYAAISDAAFNQTDPEATRRWIEQELQPNIANTRVLLNDQGEILTILNLLYFGLWLGERPIQVAGFADVASPPENRRQGYIRHMFVETLKELHASGLNVATLYPFFFPFYKKFGFEQVSNSKRVKVKLAQLQKFRSVTPGQWREVGAERWEDFNRVYDQFCLGQFGMLTRNQNWWERNIFRMGRPKSPRLYVWYDVHAQPQAYIIYRLDSPENEADGSNLLQVQRAWATPAARHEVLAFLANLDSQTETAYWYTHRDEEVMALMDDPRTVKETSEAGYMLRLLDVPKALEERAWPAEAQGSFSLAVKDDLFEWNNLSLRLDFEGGQLKTTRLREDAPIGLRCDVRQLAQLFAGYASPQTLADLNLLEIVSPAELRTAQTLFAAAGQPASHMADFF